MPLKGVSIYFWIVVHSFYKGLSAFALCDRLNNDMFGI